MHYERTRTDVPVEDREGSLIIDVTRACDADNEATLPILYRNGPACSPLMPPGTGGGAAGALNFGGRSAMPKKNMRPSS